MTALLHDCKLRIGQFRIDPSTVFPTFDRQIKAKIRQHRWKERLEISIVVKFQSEMLKTNEDIALLIKSRNFSLGPKYMPW